MDLEQPANLLPVIHYKVGGGLAVQLDEHLVLAKLGELVDLEVGDQGQLLVGRGGHLLVGLLCHSVLRAVTL